MENSETVILAGPEDVDEGYVYLVSKGEYSDYHVTAAFSTEALAQAYADEMNNRLPDNTWGWNKYFVESCAMNPPLPPGEYVRKGYSVFYVEMTTKGNTTHHRIKDTKFLEEGDYTFQVYKDKISARVIARDLEHAVKIVNEKRAIYLANQS